MESTWREPGSSVDILSLLSHMLHGFKVSSWLLYELLYVFLYTRDTRSMFCALVYSGLNAGIILSLYIFRRIFTIASSCWAITS